MALKLPLVLTNGKIEQLQAGDQLNTSSLNFADDIPLTNGDAWIANPGAPAYISAASTFQIARANASGTAKAIGLVAAATNAGASGNVRKDGTLTLTTGQWDTVTGQTGGLTAGADYFLSESASGQMTTTPPTTGFVQKIGTALSTIDFEIQIGEAIKL